MSTIYKDKQFTGTVLVADKGEIIYKKGFGYADKKTKDFFTPSTPCYIGSVTKQFTAMGIVILKEKGLVSYDQSIRQYFPDLPECFQNVSVLNMLHHSSGLPLFNDFPDMNEEDVFNIVKKQEYLWFEPGSKYEYCNANYTLLGMIIEKISEIGLNEFLTSNIFIPCGMENTCVDEPLTKITKRAIGYHLYGDEYDYSTYIGGAASVISTVEDLYKWDKMLYNPSFVSAQSLNDIFTPGKNKWHSELYGEQGYGFGWFISGNDGNKIVQHDGGFAGFRSYIERQIDKNISIIFISNVRHGLTNDIREAINNILNNKPYAIPKISGVNHIMREYKKTEMKQAVLDYVSLEKTKDGSRYYFNETECNSLAYNLLRENKTDDAIQLFKLNTEKFPESANVFDGMGEAYLKIGDKANALVNYKKALKLNPNNNNLAEAIEKLLNR